MRFLPVALLVLVASVACRDQDERPAWLAATIEQIQVESVSNPPTRLYRFRYNGETVYYRPPRCCDQFSELWQGDGTTLCHPGGGLTGRGDGRCPDFASRRSDCQLIWSDARAKGSAPDLCNRAPREKQAEY